MWKDCQALQDEITALRRELTDPGGGGQLPETAACLSAHLDRMGIPFVRSPRDSGLIASTRAAAWSNGGPAGRHGRPAPSKRRPDFLFPPAAPA